MHSSSTSSRRVATINMNVPTSRRDERTANGPLTAERAQIDQIRSMLEKTQRRLARDHAQATSQHGYNSTGGAAMMSSSRSVVTSSTSRYHSSHKHTHSRTTVHTATMSHVGSSAHYFPPDYTSARAPAVQSVYLEDLSMTVLSSQRAPPVSRAPTSYAPDSNPYYAPHGEDRGGRARQTGTTSSRADRHDRYQYHQDVRSTTHHQASASARSERHVHQARYAVSSDSDESPPRHPPSSRGILKHSSAAPPPPSSTYMTANFVEYSTHHTSVPLSSSGHPRDRMQPPPSSTSRQPLGPNGQPERSALKQADSTPRINSVDLDDHDDTGSFVAAPPPSSSRVRFQDELLLHHDAHAPLSFYPPLVEEDEYTTDDDDAPHELIDSTSAEYEPVVAIKRPSVVSDDAPLPVTSTPLNPSDSAPSSPDPSKRTRTSSDTDHEPLQRHRGSSAARTPPTQSPSALASNVRKSLTEPPKSAIDFSVFNSFDMRPRRASREKRLSNADADVDVDELQNSFLVSASEAGEVAELPRGRRSSVSENTRGLVTLSSSPIAVHEPRGFSRPSFTSSFRDDDLEDDDVPLLPPIELVPPPQSNYRSSSPGSDNTSDRVKVSPSSSSGDYSDARAFGEDDEVDERAAVVMQVHSSDDQMPIPTTAAQESEFHAKHPERKNFWEGSSESEGEDVDAESAATIERELSSVPPTKDTAAVEAEVVRHASPRQQTPQTPRFDSALSPVRASTTASSVAAVVAPRLASQQRKPMPVSQSLMMVPPPPSTATPRRNMPPPRSTHIPPSPATARPSATRAHHLDQPSSSAYNGIHSAVPRAPVTVDGSAGYVPRRLRPKSISSQPRGKAMPPSIGALSGLASGPVTFELNELSFYEVVWETGEFGFSFQRVYLEDDGDSRQMFLRMLLNTERGTCASFKHVHVGDVLIQIGDTRVCDLNLDRYGGGGSSLTKFFTDLRTKTPLRLVFQRTDPMSWEGGVEL